MAHTVYAHKKIVKLKLLALKGIQCTKVLNAFGIIIFSNYYLTIINSYELIFLDQLKLTKQDCMLLKKSLSFL